MAASEIFGWAPGSQVMPGIDTDYDLNTWEGRGQLTSDYGTDAEQYMQYGKEHTDNVRAAREEDPHANWWEDTHPGEKFGDIMHGAGVAGASFFPITRGAKYLFSTPWAKNIWKSWNAKPKIDYRVRNDKEWGNSPSGRAHNDKYKLRAPNYKERFKQHDFFK